MGDNIFRRPDRVMGHKTKKRSTNNIWATKRFATLIRHSHGTGITARKNEWAMKYFIALVLWATKTGVAPSTTWATVSKFAAKNIVWATNIFVAQGSFGPRILFRRPNRHRRQNLFAVLLGTLSVAFIFSTPNLWASTVGRRKYFRRPEFRTSKL